MIMIKKLSRYKEGTFTYPNYKRSTPRRERIGWLHWEILLETCKDTQLIEANTVLLHKDYPI